MSITCQDCNWSQGDFWSISDNPIKDRLHIVANAFSNGLSKNISERKFKLKKEKFQRIPKMAIRRLNGSYREFEVEGVKFVEVDNKTLLLAEFAKLKRKLLSMKWLTQSDYDNDNDKKCPKCNSINLLVE